MSLALLGLALVLVACFLIGIRVEPRWPGNGMILVLAVLVLVIPALFALPTGFRLPVDGRLALAAVGLTVVGPLLAGILVVFLLANAALGIIRRERRNRTALPSFVLALTLVLLVAAGLMLFDAAGGRPILLPAALVLLIGTAWLGFLFLSYLVYTLVYPRLVRKHRAQYVLVHGCGLNGREVSRILAARVAAGIAQWREIREHHPDAPIVMSGGQGPDEPRSEASAMADYAIARGVPADAILLEDRSTSTRENLRFADEVVAAELGSGRPGMSVTSSFHVLRVAALAQHLRLPVQAQPAHVVWYRWPSGFLREFAALQLTRPAASAVTTLMVVLPVPLAMAYVMAVT